MITFSARPHLLILCVIVSTSALGAPRAWKSNDGVHSVQGECIRRTASTVTIQTENKKELTIELAKLHPDERTWLNLHHPHNGAPAPDSSAVFDTLTFEDTRATTLAKLKTSKVVEMTTAETHIGRTGLNGIFRTRQKVGGLDAMLYFDWEESGKLREITLQTEPLPLKDYKPKLEPSWKEFIELLGMLYGVPSQKSAMPSAQTLQDGSFSPSHQWVLENGVSALLGTARDGSNYQLVVRFARKNIPAGEIP